MEFHAKKKKIVTMVMTRTVLTAKQMQAKDHCSLEMIQHKLYNNPGFDRLEVEITVNCKLPTVSETTIKSFFRQFPVRRASTTDRYAPAVSRIRTLAVGTLGAPCCTLGQWVARGPATCSVGLCPMDPSAAASVFCRGSIPEWAITWTGSWIILGTKPNH